jgi:hypothetical protein
MKSRQYTEKCSSSIWIKASHSRSIRDNDDFQSWIRPLFGTLDYVGFQEITEKEVLPDGRYISEKEFSCATADASNR